MTTAYAQDVMGLNQQLVRALHLERAESLFKASGEVRRQVVLLPPRGSNRHLDGPC